MRALVASASALGRRLWPGSGSVLASSAGLAWNTSTRAIAARCSFSTSLFIEDPKPSKPFRLTPSFLRRYQDVPPPFGFNGLGELVFTRTYARPLPTGERESWWQTVERVVNGTFNMQKRWHEQNGLEWPAFTMQKYAKDMYDRIFHMKFLPPGRGLWAMGTPLTGECRCWCGVEWCHSLCTQRKSIHSLL
jgi:hypothetical protein